MEQVIFIFNQYYFILNSSLIMEELEKYKIKSKVRVDNTFLSLTTIIKNSKVTIYKNLNNLNKKINLKDKKRNLFLENIFNDLFELHKLETRFYENQLNILNLIGFEYEKSSNKTFFIMNINNKNIYFRADYKYIYFKIDNVDMELCFGKKRLNVMFKKFLNGDDKKIKKSLINKIIKLQNRNSELKLLEKKKDRYVSLLNKRSKEIFLTELEYEIAFLLMILNLNQYIILIVNEDEFGINLLLSKIKRSV